jgi:hypothetical protein
MAASDSPPESSPLDSPPALPSADEQSATATRLAPSSPTPELAPHLDPADYYLDGPYLVFTAAYHLKRGSCCHSGCRHCPYGESG